jgi:RecA-family ATPase
MPGEVVRAFPQQQNEPVDSFRVISPDAWQGRSPPRRDWMVEDCFLRGTVGMVSGDGGIGKSLLMQQLTTCCVLGRPWLGRSIAGGRALYLACEDDHDELWRRQADINRSLGVEMSDVAEAGLELAPRVGQDSALAILDKKTWKMQRTGLFDRLEQRCLDMGHQLVVIDTATKTFRGNQNDENQVDDFITFLRRLAIRIQGIVILTKHPSMAGRALGTGESGSVTWGNAVRARFYLRKNKAGGLEFAGMKQNYGPAGKPIPLVWRQGVYVSDEPPLVAHWQDKEPVPF